MTYECQRFGGSVLGDVRLKMRGGLYIKDEGQRGSGREAVYDV